MSLMSMFTRPKSSLDARLPRPDTAHTVQPRRSYKDYSNCLVSVSWHQLTDEEAAARIASDFNNDFLWIRGPGGFQDYYQQTRRPTTEGAWQPQLRRHVLVSRIPNRSACDPFTITWTCGPAAANMQS